MAKPTRMAMRTMDAARRHARLRKQAEVQNKRQPVAQLPLTAVAA